MIESSQAMEWKVRIPQAIRCLNASTDPSLNTGAVHRNSKPKAAHINPTNTNLKILHQGLHMDTHPYPTKDLDMDNNTP